MPHPGDVARYSSTTATIDTATIAVRQHGRRPATATATARASADRRLGVLVDHLVEGSKEHRLATAVMRSSHHVLVTGHPYVDVWQGVRPRVIDLDAWPEVPRGQPWKEGICAALGADPASFWPHLRRRVRTYADLEPPLVGAVEQLIDFLG